MFNFDPLTDAAHMGRIQTKNPKTKPPPICHVYALYMLLYCMLFIFSPRVYVSETQPTLMYVMYFVLPFSVLRIGRLIEYQPIVSGGRRG